MKRLVLINVLACFIAASLFVVGCKTKQNESEADNPWPPDTLWLIKNAGSEYRLYEEWPPDTTAATVEVSSTSEPQMMLAPKSAERKTYTMGRPEVRSEWPPDTMRLIFRNFRARSGRLPGIR